MKRRVKKLEKKHRSRTHRLKRLYKVGLTARVESSDDEDSLGKDASKQGRIDDIDADEEITLVSVHDMNVYAGEEVVEEVVEVINTAKLIIDASQVSAAGDKVSTSSVATTVSASTTTTATITTVDDITLAQALEEMKSTQLPSQQSQDKCKGILIEPIETWDDIQAKIDVDHQLPERLQAQEQEELSVEEKATLYPQLLEKRRKHFAAKRAEEKRNKPPTKAQLRKIMCTYLKNMEGYKLNDLKLKGFDFIQEMFDRAFKRVNTFEDFRTELVEGK
ncbi:hypothetical protein Tco_1487285 [Tanacetum coccineum]